MHLDDSPKYPHKKFLFMSLSSLYSQVEHSWSLQDIHQISNN